MNDKNFSTESVSPMIEIQDCQDVIAHLGDFVDQDLLPHQHSAIETHLNVCPECAAFYASYKHVIDTAAELREPEQPLALDVQNRLRKALNEKLGINLPFIA